MKINRTPPLSTDVSKTGCCPPFDPTQWDEREFIFNKKLFVKAKTFNFMHVPINMASVMNKTWKKVEAAGAKSNEFVLLSYDPSPWRGEHYFSVTKEVPGAENVWLSGTYMTKVFEGPYKEAEGWVQQLREYVVSKGRQASKLYMYYTTCPGCVKKYGKNYAVGFAQIA